MEAGLWWFLAVFDAYTSPSKPSMQRDLDTEQVLPYCRARGSRVEEREN